MEAMTWLDNVFDGLLLLGLLALAWRALTSTDLFKGICLFIAFGLIMALAWIRLDAPDIALAEAAIGAGLSGAFLLEALARLREINGSVGTETAAANKRQPLRWLPLIVLLSVAAGLGHALLSLPPQAEGLTAEVSTYLGNSGVSNPVTAVLLNFRAYDTLLEIFVLLLALAAAWSFGPTGAASANTADPVLNTLAGLLVPLLVLVAAYLLWVGAHAPGGAFQAGSVLAAAGVLSLLAGWRMHSNMHGIPLRLLLIAAPAAFVLTAAFTMLFWGELLRFPHHMASALILSLELIATLSIAATLAGLFEGLRTGKEERL